MHHADGGVDYVSAPGNYADFFRLYQPYVIFLVKRAGIPANHVEDVASEIITRFVERDMLSMFDPSMTFEYMGEQRPARFKSFLSKIVLTYARGHKDKLARRLAAEYHLIDLPLHPDGNMWIDSHVSVDGPEDAVIAALSDAETVAYLRNYLSTIPRRSRWDTCDLSALFEEVVKQVALDGTWNITALRKIFGISSTAMHSWMWWLRTNIAHALNRPVPAKRLRANTKTTGKNEA